MTAPRWLNAEQGSDVWLRARIGLVTASRMADVVGTPAKRKALKMAILAERLTGMARDAYVSAAMQWGIDNEPMARSRYEEVTGQLVTQVGLALHPTIDGIGASPDGLVGDGLIEIKCPETATHLQYMLDQVPPEQYRPQMLLQMAVTCRGWCDFVSYDPRLPAPYDIFIVRYAPPLEEIQAAEMAAQKLLAEVTELQQQIERAQHEKTNGYCSQNEGLHDEGRGSEGGMGKRGHADGRKRRRASDSPEAHV